jgi:peptidoglycan/LPS O-acetylase OafA/YrhL
MLGTFKNFLIALTMAKLNAAESIRGLACLAVVFSHLSLSFYPYLHHFSPDDRAHGHWDYFMHHSPFAFWYSGTAAVFVFFVLSGFVLSYAILRHDDVPRKVTEMAIKRYPRLAIPAFFPVFWRG